MNWPNRRSHKPNIYPTLASKRSRHIVFLLIAGAVLTAAVMYLAGNFDKPSLQEPASRPNILIYPESGNPGGQNGEMTKESLARLIGSRNLGSDDLTVFPIKDEQGHELFVSTTLDPDLQKWALKAVSRAQTDEAALVVLDPAKGDVLAMASFNVDNKPVNLTLSSSFPAASLFKIVTAAAAVETKSLNGGSTLAYDGRKHTLYRKNIVPDVSKGRNQVTLKKSFAQSINTVFGKLGAFTLGPKALQDFAQRFYFNQPIDFEMPVETSRFVPPDDDYYRLAEIASGFNITTKVSPLHGAMLAAAIANDGLLMEPTVVREVFDRENNIYYHQKPVPLGRPISPSTVSEMKSMMEATIAEGTGRSYFRDKKRHRVLAPLEIGAKTGTINDEQSRKVDWFVSFAVNSKTGRKIALAVLVVHNKDRMGFRAPKVGRDCIIRYFKS